MKKIFLLLMFTLCISHVDAITETNITNDATIKYKWYKEIITDELYYPKKDILPDYLEDSTKIEYGPYSDWSSEYCNYEKDYYLIESKTITTYDKLDKIKYVLIANASATCPTGRCTNEVKIYYKFEILNYKVLSDSYFGLLIELPDYYEPENLLFYINTEHKQVIYLSKNKNIPPITIASPPSSENIQVISNDWEASEDSYIHGEGDTNIPLIKNIKEEMVCRISEINTYRYKVLKEYYDDNYYSELEDYIPDINDYNVYYTKTFPPTKEIIKEIPKIEKEYIYLTDETTKENTECEKENNSQETIVYKTQYIDKIKTKVPISIYIVLGLLILIIIFLVIKILSKKVG